MSKKAKEVPAHIKKAEMAIFDLNLLSSQLSQAFSDLWSRQNFALNALRELKQTGVLKAAANESLIKKSEELIRRLYQMKELQSSIDQCGLGFEIKNFAAEVWKSLP